VCFGTFLVFFVDFLLLWWLDYDHPFFLLSSDNDCLGVTRYMFFC
jgi:hypothetical protein